MLDSTFVVEGWFATDLLAFAGPGVICPWLGDRESVSGGWRRAAERLVAVRGRPGLACLVRPRQGVRGGLPFEDPKPGADLRPDLPPLKAGC